MIIIINIIILVKLSLLILVLVKFSSSSVLVKFSLRKHIPLDNLYPELHSCLVIWGVPDPGVILWHNPPNSTFSFGQLDTNFGGSCGGSGGGSGVHYANFSIILIYIYNKKIFRI